jgi:hypothetical protein
MQTDSLQPRQRGIAFSRGKLKGSERFPSVRQARHGNVLLLEAARLGFRHDAIAPHLIAAVPETLAIQ